MAVTIARPNLTDLWDADSTLTFTADTGSFSFSTFSDRQREGTACNGATVSNTTARAYRTFTSFNMSTNRNKIYIWMYSTGFLATTANGGFQIGVGDGTNRRYYYVGGSDYYGFQVGPWSCFCLDPNNLPTAYYQAAGSAAPNFAAVTQVGIGNVTLAKSLGGVENFFLDIARWGSGIQVQGGTSGAPGTWAEIAAADASKSADAAFGMIRELASGVFGIQGDIIFGDSGTSDSYFAAYDEVVTAEDTGAAAVHIGLEGNSAGTNSFVLGTIVGSGDTAQGRNGCTIMSSGPNLTVDFAAANFDTVDIFGSKFFNQIELNLSTNTTHQFIGNVVDQCLTCFPNQCIVRGCTFSNVIPTTGANSASLVWNSSINIKNCQFLANNDPDGTYIAHAIEHPDAGEFTYIGLTFLTNEADIWFSATSGNLIINATFGSNPTTFTNDSSGDVTISNPKSFTFTLYPSITGYEWRLYYVTAIGSLAGAVEQAGEENASADNQTFQYNYASDQPIAVQIIDLVSDIVESITYYTLGDGNQSVTILTEEDRNN